MAYKYTNNKVIYPELSYIIVGCLFNAFNNLGPGRREKVYQNAVKQEFIIKKIKFQEQLYNPIKYKNVKIGKQYFDFIIEDKIILEIKVDRYFKKKYLEQILDYLKTANIKLGIIANFTRDGVKSYRVVNIK